MEPTGKRVLVVDDNEHVRELVKSALETVLVIEAFDEAEDGVEALERARAHRPDLVILDLSMPNMDGLTAAKGLKRIMPEVPIVLFTMHNLGKDSAKTFGVDAVVSKPDGMQQLTASVQSLLVLG